MRGGILFTSTQVLHRPGPDFSLHFDIKNTLQIRTQRKMLALGVCQRPFAAQLERWPQVCHVKITFTLLPTNCVVSTTANLIHCLVN